MSDSKIEHAICQSGKFETGEGTCALACMDQLGSARKSRCSHAPRIHKKLADQIRGALEKWQPIETAPKDETCILLHGFIIRPSVDAGKHSTVIGYWTDFNTGGWVWHGATMEFTHWQPLPEPPTKDAE